MSFDNIGYKGTNYSLYPNQGNFTNKLVFPNDSKRIIEENDYRKNSIIYSYGVNELPSSPSELPQNKNTRIPYAGEERSQTRLRLNRSRGNIRSDGIEESQYQTLIPANYESTHSRENIDARRLELIKNNGNRNLSHDLQNLKVHLSFNSIRGSTENRGHSQQGRIGVANLSQSPEIHRVKFNSQIKRENDKNCKIAHDRNFFSRPRHINYELKEAASSGIYNSLPNNESKILKQENEKLINYIKELENRLNIYETLYEKSSKIKKYNNQDLHYYQLDEPADFNQDYICKEICVKGDYNLINEKNNKKLKDENYKLKSIMEKNLHKNNKETTDFKNIISKLNWNNSDLEFRNKRLTENIVNLEKTILETNNTALSIYNTLVSTTHSSPLKFYPDSPNRSTNYSTPQKSVLLKSHQRSNSPSKSDLKSILDDIERKSLQILNENNELNKDILALKNIVSESEFKEKKYLKIISTLENKVSESEFKEKEYIQNIKDFKMESSNFYANIKIQEKELEARNKKLRELEITITNLSKNYEELKKANIYAKNSDEEITITNLPKKYVELEKAYEMIQLEFEKANAYAKNSDEENKMIKYQIYELKSEKDCIKRRLEQVVNKSKSTIEKPIPNQDQLTIKNLEEKVSSINNEFDQFKKKSQIDLTTKEIELNQYREQVQKNMKEIEMLNKLGREWDSKEKFYIITIQELQEKVSDKKESRNLMLEKEDLEHYASELENEINELKKYIVEVDNQKVLILNLQKQINELSSQKNDLNFTLNQYKQSLNKKEEENKDQADLINKQKESIANLKNKETSNEMDNSKIKNLTLRIQNYDKRCEKLFSVTNKIRMHSKILTDAKVFINQIKLQLADELKRQKMFIDEGAKDFENKISPILLDNYKAIDDLKNQISFLEQEIICKNETEIKLINEKNHLEKLCEIKDKEIENMHSSNPHIQEVTAYLPVSDQEDEEKTRENNLEKGFKEMLDNLNDKNFKLQEELNKMKTSSQIYENENKRLCEELEKFDKLKIEYQIKYQDLEKAYENIMNLNENLNKEIQKNYSLIDEMNNSISLYENREKENSERANNKIKILSEKLDNKELEIKNFEQIINDIKNQKSSEIDKNLKNISKLQADLEDANMHINELKDKLHVEENKFAEIIKNQEKDKDDFIIAKNDEKSDHPMIIYNEFEDKKEEFEHALESLKNDNIDKDKQIKLLQIEFDKQQKECKNLVTQYNVLDGEYKLIQKDKENIESENMSLKKDMQNEIEKLKSKNLSYEEEKENMKNEIEKLKSKSISCEEEKEKLHVNYKSELQQLQLKSHQLNIELEKANILENTLKSSNSELHDKIKLLENEKKTLKDNFENSVIMQKSEIERTQDIVSEREKISKAFDDLKQEYNILMIQFKEIKKESEDKSKSLQNLQQNNNSLKNQSSRIEKELNEKLRDFQNLQQEKDILKNILQGVEKELSDKSNSLQDFHHENSSLKNNLQGLEKELNDKSKALQNLNQENSSLKNNLQGIEKELNEKLKALQDLHQENGSLKNNLQRIEKEINDKSKALHQENSSLKNTLQGIEKEVNEKSKALQDLHQENSSLKNNLQGIGKGLNDKSKALQDLHQENTSLKNTLQGLEKELNEKSKALQDLHHENNSLKNTLQRIEKEFEGKSRALEHYYTEENTKIRSQITDYYNAYNNLNKELTVSKENANNISSENKKLNEENESLKKELLILKSNQDLPEMVGQSYSEIINQYEMEISNLKNNIKQFQENNSKIAVQNRELNNQLIRVQKEYEDIKLQKSNELALQEEEIKRLRNQITPNVNQILEPLKHQLEELKQENIYLSHELNTKTLDLERISSQSQEFQNAKLDELKALINKLTIENKELKNLVRALKNS
ncbi:hypothetical protein SteCoe_21694 [Stentor coeruleus]|uniref:Uncharacterized protein n=1 Tax=Stentor coeruleus TaxID=5963 RepID=A0A1R2BNT6_9CILI|nr:hypothetical protein SteCoe_21694 [Stentor coeruleus]